MANEKFGTVREFSRDKDIPEHAVRRWLKEKKLPVVYVGNRALIPYAACIEALQRLATENQS